MTAPVNSMDSVRHTDLMWTATTSLRHSIDQLEFLTLLGEGKLPLDAFRTYLEQDRLYLAGYAKALAILASKAPDTATAAFWATSAASAVEEATLHESLLSGDALPTANAQATHSPTCLGYVSYLVATAATEPYPVAAAAILPCFWIYADVAVRLSTSAKRVLHHDPNHPYAQWVSAYNSDEFRDAVDCARLLVDDAARLATDAQRSAMIDSFVIATRYESMFWDSALHPTPWPLPSSGIAALEVAL
ncbi:TenA family transcriptional regulator [Rhodococcus sp. PAMC28707]|uniref:TenA family protein n=1 Tax=unclassified Rhodococcus (in: high G+C Gram-positive bacteria) TaxID=192944 RepID=UPI00109DD579|nr:MULTISPECIES: TenA family protein [unclassified Rhodococcus (in: high G+C Gram-positive bacteria)]QCB52149.1 TenA family transcriptional regulator [Rhodococcus sp. PAMC28705]QCB59682.1 TenA family transcriptional regulator [Rhodococcus sp. PAMC28707]